MKFPKVIRHRKAEVTIYGKKPNYQFYRIAYRVAGKRDLRNYSKYGEALKQAEKKVRELADGSQAGSFAEPAPFSTSASSGTCFLEPLAPWF